MGTLTFLFTDIEGSTMLLTRWGEETYARALGEHCSIIRRSLSLHEGSEISTQGDSFFAVFSSPRSCLAAVVEMQQALEDHAWPQGERLRVRMGMLAGEASERGDAGLVGLDVHRAARVAAVGHGGQVLLSETAAALVRDSLPAGASLHDLGLHRLKDLGRPERLYQLEAPGLQSGFPPLRSLDNPALQNNLPAQLTTFIGRRHEVAQVRELVGSSRLVTLTGAGGAGKTRLALQVAAELLDGSGDGVWLADLAAVTDEQAVPKTVLEALGITASSSRPAPEALVDALAPQRLLIVLDNCEHLVGACAKLADTILRRCPQVHVLATSREPLGIGGEAIYRVPSMSLPPSGQTGDAVGPGSSDAMALFMERARSQGTELVLDQATTPLALSICRRLDGMPLAIELAAARLGSLSLANLNDRLDQRFRLLTGGSRSALPRQQTLRATVEWSYSLLNRAEQVALQRLAVFADGCDLEAAEAVCGFGEIDLFDVTDLLGSLVAKSLVVADKDGGSLRYRLLQTIRQFAAEYLAAGSEQERAAVDEAHARYFLSLAETAAPHLTGPEQRQWFARLDADQQNLRKAIAYAAQDVANTELVLRFAAALQCWWSRARADEASAILTPVLARPEAAASPKLFAEALMVGAGFLGSEGSQARRRMAEQAIEVARGLGDERLIVTSLRLLAASYAFAGSPEQGMPFATESVERARRLGQDNELASSLSTLVLCCHGADPAAVPALFKEAITAAERSGNVFITAMLQNNAGATAITQGDYVGARDHLERCAEAAAAAGVAMYHVKVNLGMVLLHDGASDGARELFDEAARISRRSGDRYGLAYSALGLALVAGAQGASELAATTHGVAQSFIEQIGLNFQWYAKDYQEASMAALRAELGDERFERAFAKGKSLGFDEAIDLALSRRGSEQPE